MQKFTQKLRGVVSMFRCVSYRLFLIQDWNMGPSVIRKNNWLLPIVKHFNFLWILSNFLQYFSSRNVLNLLKTSKIRAAENLPWSSSNAIQFWKASHLLENQQRNRGKSSCYFARESKTKFMNTVPILNDMKHVNWIRL